MSHLQQPSVVAAAQVAPPVALYDDGELVESAEPVADPVAADPALQPDGRPVLALSVSVGLTGEHRRDRTLHYTFKTPAHAYLRDTNSIVHLLVCSSDDFSAL